MAPTSTNLAGSRPRRPDPAQPHHGAFRRLAEAGSSALGTSWSFALALLVCVLWALAGPLTGYSDSWQLTINTATTLVTFLAVFLIQNTQNRHALAIHLKLDELLRAVDTARTAMVNLEELSDEELARLRQEFERLGHRAGRAVETPRSG